MSEDKNPPAAAPAESNAGSEPSQPAPVVASTPPRQTSFRWCIKLVLQPALFLVVGVLLILALGAAQKLGWISAGSGVGGGHASSGAENVRYICPMMCTPPQTEPGRCPVCAMELVPATSGSSNTDELSIQVDPAARRVANIRTAPVKAISLTRKIRAIGELSYDEGTLKTIAAYVDGRLDCLYADYTGVVVEKGDHLALLYSPRLYSSQVELLVAKRGREQSRSTAQRNAAYAGRDLYGSATERLIEFGMTMSQIEQLEQAGEADSRMNLCAPISGTVIEKLAVEGQYVKTGQPIYRLADLSTVWLMLELFPEDVAAIRYGQKVEAEVQSLPGRKFTGRVAFIDPTVDPKTRTVGVRVVMPNEDGLLRIGDYAKSTIAVELGGSGDLLAKVYDPELADKWISPRHPHVVESSPGSCRVCGVDLVPAVQLGFASQPTESGRALVVPRNAVLMAGESSVVYVETEPGRFEIRSVVLGPSSGNQIAILEGVNEGEQVACSGNFLIDSQMQLAGNPSLIDPTKAEPRTELDEAKSAELIAALSKLPANDRALAESQQICPVTKLPLGSMGTPPKVDVNGRPVFICCKGCETRLLAEPDKYLANLSQTDPHDDEDPQIAAALAKLSPQDRALAKRQRICPVTELPLGSMGTPPKVDVNGVPVFICCEGCREGLLREPEKHLVKSVGNSTAEDSPEVLPPTDLQPIGSPQAVEPQPDIPRIEASLDAGNEASEIAEALATLSSADHALARNQRVCPVTDMPLGSMGTPIKVNVAGRPVFICCEGCRAKLLAEPVKYLAKLPKEAVR
ncbi:MAG: efflux RND transporter periplasmic adaptor subunit [Planctomycetota bacterium]|jgi:Cu(I)/Ag(I) efflux system membrane fusion protein